MNKISSLGFGLLRRRMMIGLVSVGFLAVTLVGTVLADDHDNRGRAGHEWRGPHNNARRGNDRDWRAHEGRIYRSEPYNVYAPPVIYAPPIYEEPGINFIIPLHIH